MTRTIQDEDLLIWEAYATSGDWGLPDQARMMFQCLSDPGRRARMLEREGDKSDVEEEIVRSSEEELLALLGQTEELK